MAIARWEPEAKVMDQSTQPTNPHPLPEQRLLGRLQWLRRYTDKLKLVKARDTWNVSNQWYKIQYEVVELVETRKLSLHGNKNKQNVIK